MIAIGPVTSRRFGKSLGVNNIYVAKVCSYSCVYCQLGRTLGRTKERSTSPRSFYNPQTLFKYVSEHISQLDKVHKPDHITFVASGEPTLDVNLNEEIRLIKKLNIPVAVMTNASLLYEKSVRKALMQADVVSIKVDTLNEKTWRRLNRPAEQIDFEKYLKGIKTFAKSYKGKLLTETMLVHKFNDSEMEINMTAYFISKLEPTTAYLLTPIRPPSERTVSIPSITTLFGAKNIFMRYGIKTELLNKFEEGDIAVTGNAYEDILNISAVHPIREDVMLKILRDDHANGELLASLINEKLIQPIAHQGIKYYVRQYHL